MKSIPEKRYLIVSPGTVENIRKIYNLDKPERLEEAIKILEDWIQKQDHIIKKDFDRRFLETSLISCKGSVEKSKKQIDRLCTLKTLLPKFFSKVNPKIELPLSLNNARLVPLPMLTEDNYRILMIKFNNKGLTAEILLQYFQFSIISAEYFKVHDYNVGYILIYDFNNCNLIDLITTMNTVELQQFVTIITEGFRGRLKCINILTDSLGVEIVVKAIKLLLSEKLGNRIQTHSTLEDLHKAVPKEILPVEYGGNERSIDKLHEEWVEELSSEEYLEYMKVISKACSDESKRNEGKFNDEYMGMPGSFRCLSVD